MQNADVISDVIADPKLVPDVSKSSKLRFATSYATVLQMMISTQEANLF